MIKAVIFDVDGTLIDSVDLHAAAWVEALRHFGIDAAFGDVRSQIGKGGDQLLPVFVSAERLAQEEQKISDFRSDLFKRQYLPRVRAFPGVPALFQRIRLDGLKVALASSGKADEVDDYARIAGVTELIDLATTADDAERSKPEPDIFEAALARLAPISAAESIVIGDTPWDVIAANKAGLRTIGMLCGGFPEDELRKAGAIAIFKDPEDLFTRYDSSPLAS
jgi:beta-phosphoglucomutase-like phosphatase (HAD superfamily)